MGKTSIEWTRGDDGREGKTWNPLRGCTRESPGCINCYAERTAARFSGPGMPYAGLAKMTSKGPRWTGRFKFVEEALMAPLRWKKPARVFVNSMSDLFHEDVPDEWIDPIFGVMAMSPHHTFMTLTKRAERMMLWAARDHERAAAAHCLASMYITDPSIGERWPLTVERAVGVGKRGWPLPNVWMGVSVEDRERKSRIDMLRQTPAALRFLSLEPLLEHLGVLDLRGIDWVIVGGESGPNARPCDIDWIRSIKFQCRGAHVPVFIKQLGSKPVGVSDRITHRGNTSEMLQGFSRYLNSRKGGDISEFPDDLRVREFPQERP